MKIYLLRHGETAYNVDHRYQGVTDIPLSPAGLAALNGAIATGAVKRNDDSAQTDVLREALVTRDRKTVYRVDDGIPVLLVEDGIATAQLEGFPRQ